MESWGVKMAETAYNRFCMEFFSTIANPLRIAIVQRLIEKERNVSELVDAVKEERTLVSHNLRKLLRINLVSFKKKGKERVYYANMQIAAPLFYLMENFVCTGCSLRKTCKVLQKKMAPAIIPIKRDTCKGCVSG